MEELKNIRVILAELLRTQKLAVLSTVRSDGAAYSNLVSFAAPRPENLLFATTRATRKYANLMKNAQVALLIDNRRNDESDFHAAVAATAPPSFDRGNLPSSCALRIFSGVASSVFSP